MVLKRSRMRTVELNYYFRSVTVVVSGCATTPVTVKLSGVNETFPECVDRLMEQAAEAQFTQTP